MRRLSYGLILLLLFACGKEESWETWNGPLLELDVACVNPSDPTKAGSDGVEAGENVYHENLISWVDFYFYPGEATSELATYHIRKMSGKRDRDVFRLELTTNQVNNLIFPVSDNIKEATVFAIANAPTDLLDGLEDTSLDNIKSLSITTEFVNVKPTNHRQEHFVMSGSTKLTLAGRSQKVVSQGVVDLARYAGKITVGIKMEDRVEIETGKDDQDNPIYEVWTPRPEEMQIYLVNGMSKVLLSGTPAGLQGGVSPQSEDYLNYSNYNKALRFFDESGELYFDRTVDGYYNTFPMYTYPYHWEPGAEREPYLKLVLPWDRQSASGTTYQKEFYYKILIPQDRRKGEFLNSFVRNNWYHYDINVGVLGADTDEAAVPLEATMFVVYWQDKDVVVKHANIGNARYLSVEEEEFELYNQSSLKINYTSSNPIQFDTIRVTRPYYGEDKTQEYCNSRYGADLKQVSLTDEDTYDDNLYPEGSYYLDYSKAQRIALAPDGKDWLQDKDGAIVYTHELVNVITNKRFDYSPYTITFVVGHADRTEAWMEEYNKTVKIIQYPAIYIEATPNPDTTIKDKGEQSTTVNHGYVYINGNVWYTQEEYFAQGAPAEKLWLTISYNGGGTDMYKISTTVLDATSGFVIGDPRGTTKNNFARVNAEAPAIKGESPRNLTWYYPAEESDRTKDMIAPSFRISTKLSGAARSTKVTRQDALDRCAAFQENGFPAGRWRLPTQAEITFSALLSANKVFTWQFSDDYWSANGVVNVNKGNGSVTPKYNVTTAYVRCVYDSWYWGDDRVVADSEKTFKIVKDNSGTPNVFVWGDAER